MQVVQPEVGRHWEGGGDQALSNLGPLDLVPTLRFCSASAGMPVWVMAVILFCERSSHKRGHNAVTDSNRMGGRGR